MYRVTKNKSGNYEVWRANLMVRAFPEENMAVTFCSGLQLGELAARGELL